MGWPVHFEQGATYVAGFDRPTIVSLETLAEHVEAEGFDVLAVFRCDEVPGLPFEVRGSCPEDWDYVALVVRTGASETLDVPDRVWWLYRMPQPGEPPAPVVENRPPEHDSDRGARGSVVAGGLTVGAVAGALASLFVGRRHAAAALTAGSALGGLAAAQWVARW